MKGIFIGLFGYIKAALTLQKHTENQAKITTQRFPPFTTNIFRTQLNIKSINLSFHGVVIESMLELLSINDIIII